MKLNSFTTGLSGRVVLEVAVYFRNQGADLRITENKTTPNKCEQHPLAY